MFEGSVNQPSQRARANEPHSRRLTIVLCVAQPGSEFKKKQKTKGGDNRRRSAFASNIAANMHTPAGVPLVPFYLPTRCRPCSACTVLPYLAAFRVARRNHAARIAQRQAFRRVRQQPRHSALCLFASTRHRAELVSRSRQRRRSKAPPGRAHLSPRLDHVSPAGLEATTLPTPLSRLAPSSLVAKCHALRGGRAPCARLASATRRPRSEAAAVA